jgi:hypothetical protein
MPLRAIVVLGCFLYLVRGAEVVRAEPMPLARPIQYTSAPANRNIIRFQPAAIIDFHGLEQPMAAATLFIPHGWQTKGGVVWGQEYMCTNGYATLWSAEAPDGKSGLALLPHTKWENHNHGLGPSSIGCSLAPYTSTRAYLEALAARLKPGARILAYRDRPDFMGEAPPALPQDPYGNMQMRRWVEAGEVLFAYAERGVDMRGTLAVHVIFTTVIANYGAGMPTMRSLDAQTGPVLATFAPNGQLDFRLFEAIRRTMTPNPPYVQRITQHNLEIARGARREIAKRQQMWQETNDYINKLTRETWAHQQESADKRARWFGEMIKGVNTYNDPNAPGGRSEHSTRYDHVWRLKDGSYILTDDPNYNPTVDLRVDADKLDRLP